MSRCTRLKDTVRQRDPRMWRWDRYTEKEDRRTKSKEEMWTELRRAKQEARVRGRATTAVSQGIWLGSASCPLRAKDRAQEYRRVRDRSALDAVELDIRSGNVQVLPLRVHRPDPPKEKEKASGEERARGVRMRLDKEDQRSTQRRRKRRSTRLEEARRSTD